MSDNIVKIARIIAVFACGLLLFGVMAGCKTTSSKLTADQRAMLEAIGKWYVAQGQLDIKGFKAGIHDPEDILGVATATAPPEGATKTEVKWKWAGDTIVIDVPSQQSSVTVSASKTTPNLIEVKDSTGGTAVYVMTKIGGTWKLDVSKTKKAAESTPAGSPGAPPANEPPANEPTKKPSTKKP